MKMHILDFTVIIIYFIIVNLLGMRYSKAKSINDFFLGNRSIPWIIASLSVVATETSSLTFLSIPGMAYSSNFGFLQVALGYVIGRILIAFLLLPKYFDNRLETVYQFLDSSGAATKKTVSVVFHITRILADSVRLFATSIPLTMIMGWDFRFSIIIIGISTFIYTCYGGVKAVAIVDSFQLVVYLACAFIGIYLISDIMNLPIQKIFAMIPAQKLDVFSSGYNSGWFDIFKSYNIFSGIIGGTFLSLASHGTDHLIVQRVLACKDLKSAKKAMITSGIIVFFQFALFMLMGMFIYVMFNGKAFAKSDEVMSLFIIDYLPAGVRGIMLAGILAAAMSTLSSSINSISASTAIDLLGINSKNKTEEEKLKTSRLISVFWTVIMVAISILLTDNKNPLVEVGLSIASITYGGMLGVFVLNSFINKLRASDAITGLLSGIIFSAVIFYLNLVFWPWLVFAGFIVAFSIGYGLSKAHSK